MFELGDQLPNLPAERLVLRRVIPADCPQLLEIFGDPEVTRYTPRPPLRSLVEAAALQAEYDASYRARTYLDWGIARTLDDRLIGTVTMFHWDKPQGRAELGYNLARAAWGQGFAQEAVGRLIRFGFEELELRRWEADVDPRNQRSLDLLERLGFQREGFLEARFNVSGEIQDTVLLGLLKERWSPAAKARVRLGPGVRRMQRQDRAAVLGMLATQLEEHAVSIDRAALEAAVDGVSGRPERGQFLVLEEGAALIGFAYLGFTWTLETGGLTCWIEELYVRPEARGRGRGAALLESALLEARARGAKAMDLEVEEGHERVNTLYERAGFRRLSRRRWQRAIDPPNNC